MLDHIDQKLLNLIQGDAKLTNKELSVRLGLSVTAIYERIKKLERTQVIEGYSARVNRRLAGRDFMVFCQIKLYQHKHEYLVKFEKEVVKFEEVLECYNVSGDYDYLLKVCVKDMEAYHNFINDKLTFLDHIGSAHSMFIINELKHTVALEF